MHTHLPVQTSLLDRQALRKYRVHLHRLSEILNTLQSADMTSVLASFHIVPHLLCMTKFRRDVVSLRTEEDEEAMVPPEIVGLPSASARMVSGQGLWNWSPTASGESKVDHPCAITTKHSPQPALWVEAEGGIQGAHMAANTERMQSIVKTTKATAMLLRRSISEISLSSRCNRRLSSVWHFLQEVSC